MEISTAVPGIDKEDTAAIDPSIHTTHPSDADENDLVEIVEDRAKGTKKLDKGKGKAQKKHGVMSLPAEIRETYAFRALRGSRLLTSILDI